MRSKSKASSPCFVTAGCHRQRTRIRTTVTFFGVDNPTTAVRVSANYELPAAVAKSGSKRLMENTLPKRILILGGGFAGLTVAMELEETLADDPSVEITLSNRENFFLFTPMLHEVAASDLDLTNIVNPVRKLLKRVNFFAGEVESIDLKRKTVAVSHGFDHHHHNLQYDHLVIGLGSITNFYSLPGLAERALTMKSLGDAIHLRNRLIALLEEADTECCANVRGPLLTLVVAGGGFAG